MVGTTRTHAHTFSHIFLHNLLEGRMISLDHGKVQSIEQVFRLPKVALFHLARLYLPSKYGRVCADNPMYDQDGPWALYYFWHRGRS